MRAAVRYQYCPPDQIETLEIQAPAPQALNSEQMLVKVHASTVNRTDVGVLSAKPWVMRLFTGLFRPTIPITGTDFAGVVTAIGSGVQDFKVGDRVWGFHDEGLGTHAEIAKLSTKRAIRKLPDEIDFITAAASLEAAHYAHCFIKPLSVSGKHKILLNGATGAIGSALLQMTKHAGAYVTAVCNTKNLELIQNLGADKIYNYEKEDFTQVDEEKYDFVLDAVGKSSFGKCRPLMKPGAIYLSSELGPHGQNPWLAIFAGILAPFFSGKRVRFPFPRDIPGSMARIESLLLDGHFKPVIDRQYTLAEIQEAFVYVASGEKTGNVIVVPETVEA